MSHTPRRRQEPEKLPEPEQIQPKEPREVMAQVSSEVSPSLPPPAQAVEAAAGARKAFDPWPSTPDSPEQAEGAIQWPSVEVPPASDEAQEGPGRCCLHPTLSSQFTSFACFFLAAVWYSLPKEITQKQLEEPEKPQPIPPEAGSILSVWCAGEHVLEHLPSRAGHRGRRGGRMGLGSMHRTPE
eukprot:g9578.t1